MAKIFPDYDGSSGHVHISCYKGGKSIFCPSTDESENSVIELPNKKVLCNKNLLYFIGGLCEYMQEMFLLFANNVNSYKRYKENSFAPIHTNSWCYDSRTSGIRVVGEGDSLHLEVRFAGSDTNPYLLLVGIIGAGVEGIEKKIQPPPMATGNLYEKHYEKLKRAPFTLLESLEIFEKSEFCKRLLGEKLYDFLIVLAKHEWKEYNEHISNFEIRKYLDLV